MARKFEFSLDLRTNFAKAISTAEKQVKKLDKAVGGLGKTGTAFDKLTSQVKVLSSLSPGGTIAAGVAAIGVAAGGAVIALASANREFEILAERTGIGTEKLREYEAVLKQTTFGADLSDLDGGIRSISERLAEGASTAGGIRDSLAAIGIDKDLAFEISLETPDKILERFSKTIANLDLPPAELELRLQEIGGEDASKLLPFLKEYGKEVSEVRERVEKFNLALSNTASQNLSEFTEVFKQTKALTSDIYNEIIARIAPAITGIFKTVNAFLETLNSNVDTFGDTMKTKGEAASNTFKGLALILKGDLESGRLLLAEAQNARDAVNAGNDAVVKYRQSIDGVNEGVSKLGSGLTQAQKESEKVAASFNALLRNFDAKYNVEVSGVDQASEDLENLRKTFKALSDEDRIKQIAAFKDREIDLINFIGKEQALLKERESKTAEAESKRLAGIQKARDAEAKALRDAATELLGSANGFEAIDNELQAQLDKITKTFEGGALTGIQAADLEIVAEMKAEFDKQALDTELKTLEQTARDIDISIGDVTSIDSFANAYKTVLADIDAQAQEVRDNFEANLGLDAIGANALQQDLLINVQTQGEEAIKELLVKLGQGGFDSVIDLAINEPDFSILNNLGGEGNISLTSNIDAFVASLSEADSAFETFLEGKDQAFIDSAQTEAQAARLRAIFDSISAAAPSIDFSQLTEEGLPEAEDDIIAFAKLIEQLQLEFPEIGIESKFSPSVEAAKAKLKELEESPPKFDEILQDASNAISLFGGFAAEEFSRQNDQFQTALNDFKAIETEKNAFQAAQEQLRSAGTDTETQAATDNLNSLLQQYGVTNEQLTALGVDRSASAQQVADAITKSRVAETESARQQAIKQEEQARKAFNTDKQYRIASAIISGFEAVQSAYAFGSKYGGPIGGGIAASIAAIAVAKNVQAIRKQTFAGSGGSLSSASGAGGDIASVSQAESSGIGGNLSTDTVTTEPTKKQTVQINFEGRSSITTEEAVEMVEAIREAQAEGFEIDLTN